MNSLITFLLFPIFKIWASVPFLDHFENKLVKTTKYSLWTKPSKRSIRKLPSSNNSETDVYIVIWSRIGCNISFTGIFPIGLSLSVYRTRSTSSNIPTDWKSGTWIAWLKPPNLLNLRMLSSLLDIIYYFLKQSMLSFQAVLNMTNFCILTSSNLFM